GRIAGAPAAGARVDGDVEDVPTVVRRHGRRRHDHRRRADLLPGAGARPARGGHPVTAPTLNTTSPVRQGTPMTTPTPKRVGGGLLDPAQLWKSTPDALRKLNPATLWRNPVMFIVEVGSAFTTVLAVIHPSVFAWAITVWLWLTVLFANLAEAVA